MNTWIILYLYSWKFFFCIFLFLPFLPPSPFSRSLIHSLFFPFLSLSFCLFHCFFWYYRISFFQVLFSYFFRESVRISSRQSYCLILHVYLNATLWDPGLGIPNSDAWYPKREARIWRLKSCAGFRFVTTGLKELRMNIKCYLNFTYL